MCPNKISRTFKALSSSFISNQCQRLNTDLKQYQYSYLQLNVSSSNGKMYLRNLGGDAIEEYLN